MATLNAYLTSYSSLRGADLHKASADELARGLYVVDHTFSDPEYVLVGTAEVSVTLLPRDTVVTMQITRLREEQQNVRATAEKKATEIEQQIQSLLAITNEVA